MVYSDAGIMDMGMRARKITRTYFLQRNYVMHMKQHQQICKCTKYASAIISTKPTMSCLPWFQTWLYLGICIWRVVLSDLTCADLTLSKGHKWKLVIVVGCNNSKKAKKWAKRFKNGRTINADASVTMVDDIFTEGKMHSSYIKHDLYHQGMMI